MPIFPSLCLHTHVPTPIPCPYPHPHITCRYQWLFFINPNFYGFSAMTRVLLQNLDLGCQYPSPIECYPTSARYILTYFSLHLVNPYANILVRRSFQNNVIATYARRSFHTTWPLADL